MVRENSLPPREVDELEPQRGGAVPSLREEILGQRQVALDRRQTASRVCQRSNGGLTPGGSSRFDRAMCVRFGERPFAGEKVDEGDQIERHLRLRVQPEDACFRGEAFELPLHFQLGSAGTAGVHQRDVEVYREDHVLIPHDGGARGLLVERGQTATREQRRRRPPRRTGSIARPRARRPWRQAASRRRARRAPRCRWSTRDRRWRRGAERSPDEPPRHAAADIRSYETRRIKSCEKSYAALAVPQTMPARSSSSNAVRSVSSSNFPTCASVAGVNAPPSAAAQVTISRADGLKPPQAFVDDRFERRGNAGIAARKIAGDFQCEQWISLACGGDLRGIEPTVDECREIGRHRHQTTARARSHA